MCLPIGMLKCYSTLGAVLTLIAGLVLLGVSIYGFTFSQVWIQEANGDKNFVMIFIILADVLVIITAALGLYGIKKANSCLLFLFTILVGIFFVVLLAAGILAALAPNTMLNDDLCTGSGNLTLNDQWIVDVNTLYNQTKLFCQLPCNCSLTDLSNYSTTDRIAFLTFLGRSANGTLQAQSCQNFNASVTLFGRQAALAYVSALGSIEEYFSCTGWCVQAYPNDNLFYKFSNVQAGKPKGYCYWQLKNWVLKWARALEYTCFAGAAALALVLLFNICICAHPSRRSKPMGQRFYDPAMNTDYHAY